MILNVIAYSQESKIINRRNRCIVEITLYNSFELLKDQVYLLLWYIIDLIIKKCLHVQHRLVPIQFLTHFYTSGI